MPIFAQMKKLKQEIDYRRTFAIISHPDAGKTTLTEKFLLFGGAIQTAGAVKSNKIKKTATSDFMEIERQRGISVATSVMTFHYGGKLINILDTPGHKDFAEDTYRTLSAVDSVILVIDGAKGVEQQTRRLMEVCRMRNTPVIIFINKMDREGRDPYDLLEELEELLKIEVRPLSWPIGMGSTFKGVYNLYSKELNLFTGGQQKLTENLLSISDLEDPQLDEFLDEQADQLREDVELIDGVYGEFDRKPYLEGKVAPVFFGSALNNFGVKEMLDGFIRLSPPPLTRPTDLGPVNPEDKDFSGFVFKIHANLDPRHRDRIAFLRVCSGKFERNKFYHHVRNNKKLRFSNPYTFFADSKEVLEEAWPGDVIGLYDTGTFKIGDSLTEGKKLNFQGIPSFSPEIFKELINEDPMRSKQLKKGIHQLTDEGVAQLFTQQPGNRILIGVVGELQFDVIKYRLEHEYKAKCHFTPITIHKACWITYEDEEKLNEFIRYRSKYIVKDKDGNYVFLADSRWTLEMAQQKYPEITFHFNSEFKRKTEA